MDTLDCAVIGAGVVGLAVARELATMGREVIILESEESFGTQTSARNSEVIHAGIYYASGSMKAQLCVPGRKALFEYCAEHQIKHQRIGKLVVACDESELSGLKKYKAQAEANGVNDLEWLTGEQLNKMEPAVRCVAGFLSPSTGIIDSHGLMLSYLGEAQDHGAMSFCCELRWTSCPRSLALYPGNPQRVDPPQFFCHWALLYALPSESLYSPYLSRSAARLVRGPRHH